MPDKIIRFGFIKYNWPGISWALFILIMSSINTPPVYIPDFFDLFGPDKIVHFIFYAILSYLLISGFRKMPAGIFTRNQFSMGFILAAIYGGMIEIYQGLFLLNRTGDWDDFLANCIGAWIGYIYFKIADKRKSKI